MSYKRQILTMEEMDCVKKGHMFQEINEYEVKCTRCKYRKMKGE